MVVNPPAVVPLAVDREGLAVFDDAFPDACIGARQRVAAVRVPGQRLSLFGAPHQPSVTRSIEDHGPWVAAMIEQGTSVDVGWRFEAEGGQDDHGQSHAMAIARSHLVRG